MLDIALKEWAIVCELLLAGRQTILLRKGGIHEDEGPGRFVLEHERFLLFPSWLHQKPDMMKPAHRAAMTTFGKEPAALPLTGLGQVRYIGKVTARSQLDALDDLHGWSSAQIDMRWNYKPQNPLYVMVVEAARLAQPKTIPMTAAYGGCKSWVPLSPADAVDDAGAQPVLVPAELVQIVERCRQVLDK